MRKYITKRNFLLLIVGIVFAVVVGAGWWLGHPAYPTQRAIDAQVSDSKVKVELADALAFIPTTSDNEIGVIFYPGGLVEPGAYSGLARLIALQGYLVVIPRMPLDLAVTSPNAADSIIAQHPEIKHWVLMGHSLGGAMAARYAGTHDQIKGLILLAAYPENDEIIKSKPLAVISLYGSEDKLTADKVPASVKGLPTSARIVKISGGNHAGFGDYGKQSGDGEATISSTEQQTQASVMIADFLQTLGLELKQI